MVSVVFVDSQLFQRSSLEAELAKKERRGRLRQKCPKRRGFFDVFLSLFHDYGIVFLSRTNDGVF